LEAQLCFIPATMPPNSTTTGKIFQMSRSDFVSGVAPTVELPADHPFCGLWQDFRTKITTPYNCDHLIYTFVSVFLKNERWKDGLSHVELAVHVERIVDLIRNHPPDLLILDQPAEAGYGLHLGQQGTSQYICLTKHWFDEWTLAMAFGQDRRLALALEAVVKATLVHKLGHWIFALVSQLYL
jgi:hypothetical protein